MAQQPAEKHKSEWKADQKCEIYTDLGQKWMEAKVIDVFKDDEGEWVKVQFGRTTTEIPIDSPNIRVVSDNVPIEQLANDQDVQKPSNETPLKEHTKWETGALCQMYCVETMKWIDGEIINVFTDEMGEWLRVQCGQRIYDVLNRDPPLVARGTVQVPSVSESAQLVQANSKEMDKESPIEWRVGSLCEMYSNEVMKWIEGEIINIFNDENGKWMRVQTGMRIRDVLCHGNFCRESTTESVGSKMTWYNVLQCVTQELFPVLSFKINECVQGKLVNEPSFQISNIGEDAVKDIIRRLMEKRTMNNKEIVYLEDLFQRANQYGSTGNTQNSSVIVSIHCVVLPLTWCGVA